SLKFTLECYEEWSEDPKFYRTKVTTTPGCPSLPSSQWLLLLEGRALDLNKVFSGHYSTAIDAKQSQVLGSGFELTLSQLAATQKVKTFGDWSIATKLWIEALIFIMPWRERELREFHKFMSDIFSTIHYSAHERVLDFDRAIRLLVEQQKFLRYNSFGRFEGLHASHLSSFGMVAINQLSKTGSGASKQAGRSQGGSKWPSGSSRFGEPCHKWNRGQCEKEVKECLYYHVCDRGNCKGAHKRVECPLAKGTQ
ncbi:hypothetical protein DFH29DRAFT_804891, partial [Suillus ampliporus]